MLEQLVRPRDPQRGELRFEHVLDVFARAPRLLEGEVGVLTRRVPRREGDPHLLQRCVALGASGGADRIILPVSSSARG